jgi:acyl-coenzyme A thioesterase PaaI-like protein
MAGDPAHRDRLADALRRLIDHAVSSDVPDEEVEQIVGELQRIDERLKQYPKSLFRTRELPDFNDLQKTFRGDPMVGEHNPIAPPVEVKRDGETVLGRVNLGAAYEGPPGYVHGAIIAGIFDMLLGMANLASGNPGMTGTLTVRYRKPTPLHTDLSFEAKTDRREGRKIIAVGTLHAGGELTAEAEGTFVMLAIDRAIEYFDRTHGAGA